MEPNNKLENQFRDQLNTREIQPSPMAWDRLDAMLTIAENKKSKPKKRWLLIAASIVGILFAGLSIYQLKSSQIKTENEVVNQNTKHNQIETTKINSSKTEQIIINEVIAESDQKSKNQKSKIKNQNPNVKNHQSNHQNLISNSLIINQKTQINQIQTQLTQVNLNPEVKSKNSINVNPETLLNQVDPSKTAINESLPETIKVNATNLLSEIDNEVTQEFRETKFSKLKRNFESVKSALVSRNDR